jgi:hypothetical protein
MWCRTAAAPDKESLARGREFLSQIDRETNGHTGIMLNKHRTTHLRYGIRKNPSARRLENPFNKPDFVIANLNRSEEIVIRRASFIPPVFNILQAGKSIGRIRMCSLFRNKYAIEMDGANPWIFRMPLYTIRFFGNSYTQTGIWVALGPSKMEWYILLKYDVMEWPLLAALAFIHVEWWNYG